MHLERDNQLRISRRPERKRNMVIITAIPGDPCQFPIADYIHKLSVVNKQDYARLHGFELHVSSDIIDPNVTAVRFCVITFSNSAADSTANYEVHVGLA